MTELISNNSPQIYAVSPLEASAERWGLIQEFGPNDLKSDEAIEVLHAPLPEGYRYADPSKIDPLEVTKLMRQVEIGWDVGEDHIQSRNDDMQSIGVKILDVGIRAPDGSLVGFGSLAYRGENGELGDFVVSPNYQHRGLGKAIIAERLRMAEAAGITSIYIENFEPTNTLKSYYLENGFHETSRGEIVRGPYPIPLSQILTEQVAKSA